jgi:hypothetical protein
MRAQDMFTKQLSEDQDKAQEECNALLRELQQVRSQLATKGVERDNLNERFTKWKAFDVEQRRKTKATIDALRKEQGILSTVQTNLLSYCYLCSFVFNIAPSLLL